MAKVKVSVIGAYVDGHKPGSVISLDENSAAHLERIGYVKIQKQAEAPKEEPKEEAKSKPKAKKQKKSEK